MDLIAADGPEAVGRSGGGPAVSVPRFPPAIPLTISDSAHGHILGVVSAIGGLLAPAAALDPPPSWLRPDQVGPFRELVAALRQFGGAILALPVGAGKTWVSLGAAQALKPVDLIDVIGPAILGAQWRRTAAEAGVPIRFASHEAVSLGRVSSGTGPVIIDESHRFRNPNTKRYRSLAPTLIGRTIVLVTATPVVNRLTDLTAQLALGVRDDALRLDGVASLARALGNRSRGNAASGRSVPRAVAQLLITGRRPTTGIPTASNRTVSWWSADGYLGPTLKAIDSLALSRDRAIAQLIRTSLVRATSSSPAALAAALARYAGLLTHARGARQAGHRLSRAAVRRVVAAQPDQLILWEMLSSHPEPADLAVRDARAVERLQARLRRLPNESDGKLAALHSLLSDREPTLVFCSQVETVHYLRRRLGVSGLTWLTGSAAGWGTIRCARSRVLEAFNPAARPNLGLSLPWLLLASDVAAEGLDLQRVRRVVHYDLPWTAVRLEQRAGRARRLGSLHRQVEVIRFEVPPSVEERLSLRALLDQKGALPTRAGLIGPVQDLVQGQASLAEQFGHHKAVAGWTGADIEGRSLAGIRLSHGSRQVHLVVARDPGGAWTEAPDAVERTLRVAAAAEERELSAPRLAEAVESLQRWLVDRLAGALTATLVGPPIPARIGGPRRSTGIRQVVSSHSASQSEAVFRFLRRGHTAGEETIVTALTAGDGAARADAAALGAAAHHAEGITAHIVALVGSVESP